MRPLLRLRSLVRAVAVAAAIAATIALPSCGEGETAQPCTDIPPGGCPRSRGVACEDPACEAVYLCRTGNVWELDQRCPPRDAAARDVTAPDADASPPPPFDANVDAPPGAFGGPGCGLLQAPDCPLGTALSCPSGCCECEDLFVCENGGWSTWGTCSADAGIRESR